MASGVNLGRPEEGRDVSLNWGLRKGVAIKSRGSDGCYVPATSIAFGYKNGDSAVVSGQALDWRKGTTVGRWASIGWR